MLKFLKACLLGSLFWVLGAVPLFALDFPHPVGFVNDFAGLFSASFRADLETRLQKLAETVGAEVSVVTIETLGEETVEDYAVRLFESWQIGREKEDNGLLLLIAAQEREVRIEVGYGLEPVVTDGRAGEIIRQQIVPAFKEGDYEAGVSAAVGRFESLLKGDAPSEDSSPATAVTAPSSGPIIFVIILLVYFSSFWGRDKRIWPGALTGSALGGALSFLSSANFFLSVLGFGILGLFLDWLLSANYRQRQKSHLPTGWWNSGGGFSSTRQTFSAGRSVFTGGRSGGGFGGFGGGRSGGGGASGHW